MPRLGLPLPNARASLSRLGVIRYESYDTSWSWRGVLETFFNKELLFEKKNQGIVLPRCWMGIFFLFSCKNVKLGAHLDHLQ